MHKQKQIKKEKGVFCELWNGRKKKHQQLASSFALPADKKRIWDLVGLKRERIECAFETFSNIGNWNNGSLGAIKIESIKKC